MILVCAGGAFERVDRAGTSHDLRQLRWQAAWKLMLRRSRVGRSFANRSVLQKGLAARLPLAWYLVIGQRHTGRQPTGRYARIHPSAQVGRWIFGNYAAS